MPTSVPYKRVDSLGFFTSTLNVLPSSPATILSSVGNVLLQLSGNIALHVVTLVLGLISER